MMLTPTFVGDLLLAAILGIMLGHTWRLLQQGRWLAFEPLNAFWGGILVCYVLQPLQGGRTFIQWHGTAVFELALAATVIGLLAVVAGYESKLGPAIAGKIPRLPERLSDQRLLVAALVLAGIGLAAYRYIVLQSGGWSAWISQGRGGTDFEKVQGYIPQLAQALPAGIFILFVRAQLCRTSLLGRLAAWAGAAALTWWFLYLGSRSRLITVVILFLAAYYLPRNRSPKLWVMALGFLALLVLTNMQRNFRSHFTNLSFNFHEIEKREFWGAILPPGLGGDAQLQEAVISPGADFNCVMSVVELVPRVVPYNYGYGFLELFTRPIPRRFWNQKPYPHLESVQGVLREAGLSEATVSTAPGRDLLMGPAFTFVGHWYYVGGFLGLLMGGFVTGVLFRAVRSFWDLARGSHSAILIYPFLLTIGFTEAAATPWYWFYTLPFVVIPVLLVIWFARSRGSPRCSTANASDAQPSRICAEQRRDSHRRGARATRGQLRRWGVRNPWF